MATFPIYILTASCEQCQRTFSVEEVKKSLNRSCLEELEEYVKNVKECIKTPNPNNPNHETFKQGKNIKLRLSTFYVPRHDGCLSKIKNISFRMENMSIYSKDMLIEMKPYNFFELSGR